MQTVKDVEKLEICDAAKLAYISQTTLNSDEVNQIILALKAKFPEIIGGNWGLSLLCN